MYTYNPADIPATSRFQTDVLILQDEYKNSLKSGIHTDKELAFNPTIVGHYFSKQCEIIYETKLIALCKSIIEEHKLSNMSHINLIYYPRFNELFNKALYETHDFLEAF